MKWSLFIIFAITVLLGSCGNPCIEIRNRMLPKEYNFTITQKKYYQYMILDGDDSFYQPVRFKEFEYWGIYDSIQIGDKLIKHKGSTDLTLVKSARQDAIVFPMYCDGRPMSDYQEHESADKILDSLAAVQRSLVEKQTAPDSSSLPK